MEENKNQNPENSFTPPPAEVQPQPQQPTQQPEPVYSQPTQAPAFQPATAPQPPLTHSPANPGLIVLQWLTYAFWGWTVLAMSILTATVVANFIADADTGDFTPYGIAAALVLLPIAAVCDFFYSKQEPAKKTGAASIVMVIHAVLFALFAIGSLITAVISVVFMFTNSGDMSGSQTTLVSALIIFVFYLATFLRTLHPANFPQIRRFFIIFMVISVGLIALLGLIGPTAKARATRDDRLIEDNLSQVTTAVNDYTRENNKLPADLQVLELETDSQQLVDKNLLKYTPNTKAPSSKNLSYTTRVDTTSTNTTYYYQICATYKKASKNHYSSYDSYGADGYQTYVSAYNHKAGQNCYKVETTDYAY